MLALRLFKKTLANSNKPKPLVLVRRLKSFLAQTSKTNNSLKELSIIPLTAQKLLSKLFYKFNAPKNNFKKWHTDWTKNPCQFLYKKRSMPFFSKIKIPNTTHNNFFKQGFDIKTCWETARMQDLSYKTLQDFVLQPKKTQQKKLVQTFFNSWQSFEAHNPYLFGVNWKNPMEIGIRSVNLLWIIALMPLPKKNLEKIIASLHDHYEFINSNLETSVTPNNHFLADMVSLCYLKTFVKNTPKDQLKAFFIKTWQAFKQQLLNDATFYEGSSCYHRLNLEMMLHLCFLDQFLKLKVTDINFVQNKVGQLFLACSKNNDYLKVGDNDSAKFVFGVFEKPGAVNNSFLKIWHFQNFGLVVAKNDTNFISLRCYNFDKSRQPSGHFHHDQLSITVTLDNQKIFIEPGTATYSGNTKLRNFLRSPKSYSSFFWTKEKQSSELFSCNIETCTKNKLSVKNKISNHLQKIIISGTHCYDSITKKRTVKIIFNNELQKVQELSIVDMVLTPAKPKHFYWNWHIHPSCKIKKSQDSKEFSIKGSQYKISSTIPLKIHKTFIAKHYNWLDRSTKIKSHRLSIKQAMLCVHLL